MLQRALSPVLVGRQEELSRLEDELLAASRGDGRLVLLAGEAGIGKTRLAAELASRARKLGFDVLSGSCSEAELSIPYLPFVEAIGNRAPEALAELFPATAAGEHGQAKLRLFESVIALLGQWARERGLVLILDDIHWADSSTRELLDYVARRLARSRVMVLGTYRSDELGRRHPLAVAVQTWRRTGVAEIIPVAAMTPASMTEMIAVILDADDVSPQLTTMVSDRAEGNPFVLEEMLREALDCGWGDGTELPMPETVREAVLLRLSRLDPAEVEVLRAAAVLGRTFDYRLLAEVADAGEDPVAGALESAISHQLVEEGTEAGRYRWRHALTQESIADDMVLPKRQRIHSRAADALAARGGSAMDLASHLIAAGRAAEAADACLRAADEAERAVAYGDAAELLERVLPHVSDGRERTLLLARMGELRLHNGETATAEKLLAEAVERFDEMGLEVDAARGRAYLGRCRWELDRPEEAMSDFRRALAVLEREGPSADLALVHLRIAGIYAFRLDYERCREAAEFAVEVAEKAGADHERVWAESFVAVGDFGTAREFAQLDRCYAEALAKDYGIIAGNIFYNEVWDRVHTLAGGLHGALAKQESIPFQPWMTTGSSIARALALVAMGRPGEGLSEARTAAERHDALGATKFAERCRLVAAEALLELGRIGEAAAELPPRLAEDELQDIVYDTPPQIGVALALGRTDEAVDLARRVSAADRVLVFSETVALAVEALVAGGLLDEARDLLARARASRAELGGAGLDLAEGRILLAEGDRGAAREVLERAARAFAESELPLWAGRAAFLAAKAGATSLFEEGVRIAGGVPAPRLRDEAREVAAALGLDPPDFEEQEAPEEDVLTAGERLVTSMFADVRGYTQMATATAPEELTDRITTLQRWAAAEVRRRHGIVDKFAGDAVMATFNATGARVDHATLALEAALALRDKAALMDLPVGIGIAVGAAVVTRSVDDANVSVLGTTTNLAARLQAAAAGGEILLSDEAFRRVGPWLAERGLAVEREQLQLKGFEAGQTAYRLSA